MEVNQKVGVEVEKEKDREEEEENGEKTITHLEILLDL